MKPLQCKRHMVAAAVTVAALSAAMVAHPIGAALSQQSTMAGDAGKNDSHMSGTMPLHHQQMLQMHGQGSMQTDVVTPTLPGQDAFGAIQEIVRMLEADPDTDWSKVDLEALRQHLIDMNEVTLKADAAAKPVAGGLAIDITGEGRTLAAIKRMVPAHAAELNRLNGWHAGTEALPNGVQLTVTSSDPNETAHIRGLGFIGLLVSGSHHQLHHLAIAKGEMLHQN